MNLFHLNFQVIKFSFILSLNFCNINHRQWLLISTHYHQSLEFFNKGLFQEKGGVGQASTQPTIQIISMKQQMPTFSPNNEDGGDNYNNNDNNGESSWTAEDQKRKETKILLFIYGLLKDTVSNSRLYSMK
jgi:hypothetical protein